MHDNSQDWLDRVVTDVRHRENLTGCGYEIPLSPFYFFIMGRGNASRNEENASGWDENG
ncbi:MAG: hypothetical protein WCX22_01030 [Methanoregula sp.]